MICAIVSGLLLIFVLISAGKRADGGGQEQMRGRLNSDPVCVYAKTRDLILLRSCYVDAGETDLASIIILSSLLKRFKQEASYAGDTRESEFPFLIK